PVGDPGPLPFVAPVQASAFAPQSGDPSLRHLAPIIFSQAGRPNGRERRESSKGSGSGEAADLREARGRLVPRRALVRGDAHPSVLGAEGHVLARANEPARVDVAVEPRREAAAAPLDRVAPQRLAVTGGQLAI